MTAPGGAQAPWLVLEQAGRDPDIPTRLTGIVGFGGHRLRIVLDAARLPLGLIEYVEIPALLAMHEPSQRAVVSVMTRIADGEAVPLPYDLTSEIVDSEPQFPLAPPDQLSRARLEAAAAQVDVEVRDIERSGSDPEHVRARLVLDGRPLELEVELYTAAGATPVMAWIAGPPPDDLTAAQRLAIQRAVSGPR